MSPMDLVDLLWHYRFLGREFLVWLWFLSETNPEGLISLPEHQPFTLEIGDKISLEAGEGEYRTSLVLQGSHTDHQEARLGLVQGKLPEELHLKIHRDRLEWQLALKATTLEVKGLKSNIPPLPSDEDDDEARFFDQMGLIEEITELLDALFASFIRLRTGPDWESSELPRLRTWVRQGLGDRPA